MALLCIHAGRECDGCMRCYDEYTCENIDDEIDILFDRQRDLDLINSIDSND